MVIDENLYVPAALPPHAANNQAMGLTLAQFFSEREHTTTLTEDELLLIENYRKLSPNVKKALAQMANACKESSQL